MTEVVCLSREGFLPGGQDNTVKPEGERKELNRQGRCGCVGVQGIGGNQQFLVLMEMVLVRTWEFQCPKQGRGKNRDTKTIQVKANRAD